jgi:hypothetical protein
MELPQRLNHLINHTLNILFVNHRQLLNIRMFLSTFKCGSLLLLLDGCCELGKDVEQDETLLGSGVVAGGEVGFYFALGFYYFVAECVELCLQVDHQFLALLVLVFLLHF